MGWEAFATAFFPALTSVITGRTAYEQLYSAVWTFFLMTSCGVLYEGSIIPIFTLLQ
jgi:hypothetical protein